MSVLWLTEIWCFQDAATAFEVSQKQMTAALNALGTKLDVNRKLLRFELIDLCILHVQGAQQR